MFPRIHWWPVLFCVFAVSLVRGVDAPRERTNFDAGWRFRKGDPAENQRRLGYKNLKPWLMAGAEDFRDVLEPVPAPEGAPPDGGIWARPDFDDSSWRAIDLPHDWGIEGPFSLDNPPETGRLPWWGVAWYRKHFRLPADQVARRVKLEIDGAMSHATVWLNGEFVGGWPYGYTSWQVDLSSHLRQDGENVLAIRIDNPPDSSRWYPGGGLYRHVWLTTTAEVHVAQWGIRVATPRIEADRALVEIAATVKNDSGDPVAVTVVNDIHLTDTEGRPKGPVLARSEPADVEVAPHHNALEERAVSVEKPLRWSLESPVLYVVVTTIADRKTSAVLDRYETIFGIRSAVFDPDRGFLLNGEHVPLRGVCLHHDLGALGAALNDRALERQLRILRGMGCNAIRTSHNPPAPELLALADRMGFLVMEEAFDCWAIGKKPNDYHTLFADWHEADLRAMIRRDRNHPSVVLWSIGNEIKEQLVPDGWKVAASLTAIVRAEDRERPVTAGCNKVDSGYNGFQTAIDVLGFNYKPSEYPVFHDRSPAVPVFGSETSSCVSTRGEYFFPVSEDKSEGRADFQVSSYDLYAPRWAWPPDVEFAGLDEAPYAAGEFVWTGFDYLGEPTPYNADSTNLLNFSDPAQQARAEHELASLNRIRPPSRSSYFGILDLAGFPKDRYFLYQARWRPDLPMAHILPHWNWPERLGQVTPVHVYTSGDEAELFLNGRSLGRRKRGPRDYRLRWDEVRYQPGELHVVAYRDGKHWAEDTVTTTGVPAKLEIAADRTTLCADGRDLAFLTVAIRDAAGCLVPRARNAVSFAVTGPGEVVATDNGDPTSFVPFQVATRDAFNGRVLAIVRTRGGEPGEICVRATAEGLASGEVVLRAAREP